MAREQGVSCEIIEKIYIYIGFCPQFLTQSSKSLGISWVIAVSFVLMR